MKIETTTNYKQFKSIPGNREVNATHLKQLKEAISEKNLLEYQPVIVNERLEVIDGQHRLAACIELGIPVKYVVLPYAGLKDIQSLNSSSRSWSMGDFLNSYVTLGKQPYIDLQKFCQTYSLPISLGAILLGGANRHGAEQTKTFRDGLFTVKTPGTAHMIAQQLVEYKKCTVSGVWRSKTFMETVLYLNRHEVVPSLVIVKRLVKNGVVVKRQTTSREYLRQIEEAYNFRLKKKVRLFE